MSIYGAPLLTFLAWVVAGLSVLISIIWAIKMKK